MNRRPALAPHPPNQPAAARPGPRGPAQVRAALRSGRWDTAVRLALAAGVTGADQLTDTLFYLLHPELRGKRIGPAQRDLAREWIEIRDRRVRPALEARTQSPAGAPASTPAGASASTPAPPGRVSTSFGLDTASVDDNKNPDWMRAKAQVPLGFAIIRANYGTVPDPVFLRDWRLLKEAGLVRGAYLFLRFPTPRNTPPDPVAQARAFIATVKQPDQSDLPPALDVEIPATWKETGRTPRQLLDSVRAAWQTLRDYYGVAPMIYTSARVWNEGLTNLPAPDLAESPLWVKYYPYRKGPARHDPQAFAGGRLDPPVPPPWGDAGNWWIHQYQGDAVGIPGFSSTVDMNRFNTTIRGAAGGRVRWVQRRLGVPPNGTFDAPTDQALRAFQKHKGVAADGVIDPRTFAFLGWTAPR